MAAACGAESGWEYLLEKDALGPWAHSCRLDGGPALRAAAVRRRRGEAVGAAAALRGAARLIQNFRPPKRCVHWFTQKPFFEESWPVLFKRPPKKTLKLSNFFQLNGLLPLPGVDGLEAFSESPFEQHLHSLSTGVVIGSNLTIMIS
jgi:hypothetical protein